MRRRRDQYMRNRPGPAGPAVVRLGTPAVVTGLREHRLRQVQKLTGPQGATEAGPRDGDDRSGV